MQIYESAKSPTWWVNITQFFYPTWTLSSIDYCPAQLDLNHHIYIMASVTYETCPTSAPFFGFAGVTAALCLSNIGAAYGTAKAGVGISSMGVMNPGAVIKNVLPVVLAGILGIYGL